MRSYSYTCLKHGRSVLVDEPLPHISTSLDPVEKTVAVRVVSYYCPECAQETAMLFGLSVIMGALQVPEKLLASPLLTEKPQM